MKLGKLRIALLAGVAGLASEAALAQDQPQNQTQEPTSEQDSGTQPSDGQTRSEGEILITAQKWEKRLQDVALPVTAVPAETLVDRNQLRLQDYYTQIPGLDITAETPNGSRSAVVIRGVTTGGNTNPTTGIVIDDVPIGSSTATGGGGFQPDIDPSELQRIEVLRGPQGTLYGASSIGGLFKLVTADPSTQRFSGRFQADVNNVEGAAELGYAFRGSLNVPLGSDMAMRIGGFTRRDAGYIDDPFSGIMDVNEINTYGGRVALLWRVSPDWTLRLSGIFQDTEGQGTQDITVGTGLGDLQQRHLRQTGRFDSRVMLGSATLTGDLGGGLTLTSVSSYTIDKAQRNQDRPNPIIFFLYGNAGSSSLTGFNDTEKFTQELRLSGTQGNVDWLVGTFFQTEDSKSRQERYAHNQATGAIIALALDNRFPTGFTEYAGFANASIHFTEQLSLDLGGRYSTNKQRYEETGTGPFIAAAGFGQMLFNPRVETEDDSFTFQVAPSFKITPDMMLYARVASGYRPGGPNLTCILLKVPCEYGPDTTVNYELGFKGSFFRKAVYLEASVFRIDWKDMQLQLFEPTVSATFFGNASAARSEGVELAITVHPWKGATLSAWGTHTKAVLTEDLPPNPSAIGKAGDRLPGSTDYAGYASFDQEFTLTQDWTASFGGEVSYTGDRVGTFRNVVVRQLYDDYTRVNLRASISNGSYSVNAFVNNLLDSRGLIAGGLGTVAATHFIHIKPRTVGMSVAKKF